MKIEDLKVGELYYDCLMGVIVLTEIHAKPEVNTFNGNCIGTYERLMGSREYSLYDRRLDSGYFRPTTDEQIEEELFNTMTNFNVGNFSLSISERDIYLTGDDQQISLKKEEVRELIKILQKEVNL